MSNNLVSKDEAINQLYTTIKTKFEKDGVLQEVRCLLQSKMVSMMRGINESNSLVSRTRLFGDSTIADDSRIALLNQLIMEYLHWHNFHYTAEMLALESAIDNTKPRRDYLESTLGQYPNKNLPILLQIVAELMAEQKQ